MAFLKTRANSTSFGTNYSSEGPIFRKIWLFEVVKKKFFFLQKFVILSKCPVLKGLTNISQNTLFALKSLKWPFNQKSQPFDPKYQKKKKNSPLVNPLRPGRVYIRVYKVEIPQPL